MNHEVHHIEYRVQHRMLHRMSQPMKQVVLWTIAVPVGLCLYVLILVVMNGVALVESRKRRAQNAPGHSRRR